MSTEPLVDRLHRLSAKIASGDVVFFVGAGFSLDSERNDAGVLVARLLARFHAIVRRLLTLDAQGPEVKLATSLATGVQATFGLRSVNPIEQDTWPVGVLTDIGGLASNYYLINDWMCSAFDALLQHADVLDRHAAEIHAHECQLFSAYAKALEHRFKHDREEKKRRGEPIDEQRFIPPVGLVPPRSFAGFSALAKADAGSPGAAARATPGKALFLDTMGFGNAAVMAGEPNETRLDAVFASYADRLRPRHAAVAWMALEGLLPAVVTTNYDLLLEGAYRLAGMQPLFPDTCAEVAREQAAQPSWNRRLRNFTPIADATQFFSHGDGHQSALILKIHGCVYMYRKESCDTDRWRRILPTLVFTFREIQNWRDDSWSRDYLRSLLRTRTVVFAGYSTTDTVIHDTFRSVYEEMARYRMARIDPEQGGRTSLLRSPETPRGGAASAFVFNVEGKREFHALEILRAASAAAGDPSHDPTDHPNLVGFSIRGRRVFPSLDEVSYQLFHEVYRRLQQQALASELRRVAYQLFGTPAPEREAAAIEKHFRSLVLLERASLGSLQPPSGPDEDLRQQAEGVAARFGSEPRRAHELATAWTVHFHRSLMREYAAADLLVRAPERAGHLHTVLRWPFYAPINEHPEWAAWAVVVELAIRRRCALWARRPAEWLEPVEWAYPAAGDRPIVRTFKTRPDGIGLAPRYASPRVALTIEIGELRQLINARTASGPLDLLPRVVWLLRKHAVPWWQSQDQRHQRESDASFLTPDANALWRWAVGSEDDGEKQEPDVPPGIHDFFRGTTPSRTCHDAA